MRRVCFCVYASACVSVWKSGGVLSGLAVCVWVRVGVWSGGLAVVLHSGDCGLAEETVLVVHQVLVDAGSTHTRTHTRQSVGGAIALVLG